MTHTHTHKMFGCFLEYPCKESVFSEFPGKRFRPAPAGRPTVSFPSDRSGVQGTRERARGAR